MPKTMPRHYKIKFWLMVITALIIGILIHIFPSLNPFKQTETILAWFAIFWVYTSWAQQVTNLRGLSYIFGSKETKDTLDKQHTEPTNGGLLKMFLRGSHWVTFGLMITLVISLVFSTINDFKVADTYITKSDMQELIKNNQQTNQKTQELIDRIDRLSAQMEANNVATNK